jgi:hypothetical protein
MRPWIPLSLIALLACSDSKEDTALADTSEATDTSVTDTGDGETGNVDSGDTGGGDTGNLDSDDTGGGETGGGDTATPATSFRTSVLPIFQRNCQRCHGTSGGLDLSDRNAFASLVNVPATQLRSMDRVEPGNASRSYLWLKLDNTHVAAGGSGGRMPSTALPSGDLSTIERWIVDGAAE